MLIFEGFLLGVITATSLMAGVYFLKFWRETADSLFVAFSVLFFIQGANSTLTLWYENPNEGNPLVYTIRLFSFLFLLAAILRKNRGKPFRSN